MMAGLAAEHGEKKTVIIDATCCRRRLKNPQKLECAPAGGPRAHLIFRSLGAKKGARPPERALLSNLPDVDWLLGDRGYDADWFREALQDKGIRACIPSRKQRKATVRYDKRRYKRRNSRRSI